MVETVESRLKKARLDAQLRRNRIADADEEMRGQNAVQAAISQVHLGRLLDEEAILWARASIVDGVPALDAAASSLLMDISRRRMLELRPGALSASNSSISAAMIFKSARCPSSSRPTSDSNCTNVSPTSSSNDTYVSPELSAIDSDILDRFQHRVVRVEFVRSVTPSLLRTILHLSPEEENPTSGCAS